MPSSASSTAAALSVADVLKQAAQPVLNASTHEQEEAWPERTIISGQLLSREVQAGLYVNMHDVLYLGDCAFDARKERSLSCGLLLAGEVAPIGIRGYDPVIQTRGRPFLFGLGQATQCDRLWRAGTRSRGAGVTLNPDFLERFGADVAEDGLALLHQYLQPGSRSTVLPSSRALTQIAARLLDHPYRGPLASLFLESSALQFVLEIAFLLRDEDRLVRQLGRWHLGRVTEAREMLDARLADPPSSLELARQVGVNLTTLQENFKTAYGLTLFAYVRVERLKLARELILDQGLGIAEAGYRVGFGSPAAFTAAYRRQFGHPPSAERGATLN
ncbi:AraC family transcriptional regulator [Sphingobium sp. YR768]|uniref:AraC family transcriptional regulator n=1 Tax=Sphingobium sp. YR768 TaxID=1884365 RepID=UPI0008CB4D81|nr:AraC family transcriptional regulator [Sphingobium sp. YR768]SER25735.1 AraC-type DNA-binding protein [Sphingobium sp. YR768]